MPAAECQAPVSLWQIVNNFKVDDLTAGIVELENNQCLCKSFREQHGGGFPAPEPLVQAAKKSFQEIELLCDEIGLDHARAQINVIGIKLNYPMDISSLLTNLENAETTLLRETWERKFLYINEDCSLFVDNPNLLGAEVVEAFPSAKDDIREAGNCLAAECTTSAVFHLMRVAEYGLRALAKDRRIKVPRGALELATWEDIIQRLETAEQKIQGYPKTLAREAQFEFYHGAMMEFKRFKNKFRNRLMHARDSYDRHQARSALDHVGDFMKILASRISESKRTPLTWKGKKWVTP